MRFLPAGDRALIVEFGDSVDLELLRRVTETDQHVQDLIQQGHLSGILETVPTFRSLAILFDPVLTDHETIKSVLNQPDSSSGTAATNKARIWSLPVCYAPAHGLDLAWVADQCGGSLDDVVQWHTSRRYQIYMLGFLPGFPFMGDVDPALRLPRRTEPRVRVPKGSVSIANQLTAIYPWESPGGWHILGRCPVPLFDPNLTPPARLDSGDHVEFVAVTEHELALIENDLAQQRLDTRWTTPS